MYISVLARHDAKGVQRQEYRHGGSLWPLLYSTKVTVHPFPICTPLYVVSCEGRTDMAGQSLKYHRHGGRILLAEEKKKMKKFGGKEECGEKRRVCQSLLSLASDYA